MERFVSKRCKSDHDGSCRWKNKMPALLRLDSSGDNHRTNVCKNSPKMTDSKEGRSYCSMKSLKKYFKLGNFLESAFGFGSMSTRRNFASSDSETIPYEVGLIAEHPRHVHDIYKESKMADSFERGKKCINTTSRFWQGIGFGCVQKASPKVSCRPNRELLNDHRRDMNSFRQFDEKTLEHHPQRVNMITQIPEMCQTYRHERSDTSVITDISDKRFRNHCSSPRSNEHSRGYSSCNSRRHHRIDNCNHFNGDTRSSEIMRRSFKDNVKTECGTDTSLKICSGKKLQSEIKGSNTKHCDRVKIVCDSNKKKSSTECQNVQIDWFTYGDTGYASVNDYTKKTLNKHQEFAGPGKEKDYDIGHSKNAGLQLGGSNIITENVQQNEESKHLIPEASVDVVNDCDMSESLKPPSSSSYKPFHCSNIAKSNGAKDYSYMLFVRSSKKHRPSAKKRRRRKAREQCIQFCSIKTDSNNLELNSGLKSCPLAFIMGVDLKDRTYNDDQTRSFYVSFSDDDDIEFSDEEDKDGDDKDWNICGENEDPLSSLCLFNFKFTCSQDVTKPNLNEPSDKIQKYNLAWDITEGCTTPAKRAKKVHFPDGEHLVKVHPMIAWGYAYRSARKGPWEQFARDRERFSRRITEIKDVILPVLEPTHRNWILSQHRVSKESLWPCSV